MATNYRTPTEFLSSISLEFNGSQYLFGLTNSFQIKAPGSHRIFPYCTGGTNFRTRSTEDSVVGSFSFSGMLLGDVELLRTQVFEKLGVIQSSGLRLRVSEIGSGITLAYYFLEDYRIGSIGVDAELVGNTVILTGRFEITFRDFSMLP